MPSCGNHEACGSCAGVPELTLSAGNFTQYRARMHAVSLNSNTGNNIFYSFNRGLTHFLVFSAEAYLYARSEVFLANQLAFIKADLAAVDRRVTPWVVGAVHKDWTMEAEAFAAFSPVLEAGGVDVTFVGHVHYYNRYMPYNPMLSNIDTAAVSADGGTYTDAKWMVTIVTGAAGNHEDEKAYVKAPPSYTGVENYGAAAPLCAPPAPSQPLPSTPPLLSARSPHRRSPPSPKTGYGYWQALNATHATWDWKTVAANKGPQNFTDHLTLVQHGRGHLG